LPSYSLGWLGPELGFDFDHHEAGADAAMAAQVVLCAARTVGAQSVEELLAAVGFVPAQLSASAFVGVSFGPLATGGPGPLHNMEGNHDADPAHPLFDRTVCFTGGLFSMVRRDAAEAVMNVGGSFVDNMSTNVDYLVIGDADFVSFADGHRTGKIEHLMHLRDVGKSHTEVLSERDFLALLHS
jgi:DNA polymerase-3 subunit epsilon